MPNIEVRAYSPSDQVDARALIEEGLGERFGYVDSSFNPDLDDIHATFVASGGGFFVAVCDGVLVGTSALLFRDGDAEVVRVSTHPEFRRRGIASALLQEVVAAAHDAGHRRLIVHTQPEWTDAVSFYLRRGFVPCGRRGVDIQMRLEW